MKTKDIIKFLLIIGCILVPSCEEELRQIQVSTGIVVNIEQYRASVSGEIIDLGSGATQHGHCYSEIPNPTINDSKTELGVPSLGCFSSGISGLNPGTWYYVRSYCKRGEEIVYGNEINFMTRYDDGLPGGVYPRVNPCS